MEEVVVEVEEAMKLKKMKKKNRRDKQGVSINRF